MLAKRLLNVRSRSIQSFSTVGFVGLGMMGANMAKNLVAKLPTSDVRVFDVVDANMAALEEKGAKRASSIADLANVSSTIITMLPATQHVASVLRGPDGIFAKAKRGTLIIDCSTIDPVVSRELHAEAELHGHRMIDAPVNISLLKSTQLRFCDVGIRWRCWGHCWHPNIHGWW
jgi:3-hydroxyisobutyrate dehydrogenase